MRDPMPGPVVMGKPIIGARVEYIDEAGAVKQSSLSLDEQEQMDLVFDDGRGVGIRPSAPAQGRNPFDSRTRLTPPSKPRPARPRMSFHY